MTDLSQLDAAIADALQALEAAGIPADRAIIGVTDLYVKGEDTEYATHVGATENRRTATLIKLVTDDLAREAGYQQLATFDEDTCPECGSRRWGRRNARRPSREDESPGIYIDVWRECMSCGHCDRDEADRR